MKKIEFVNGATIDGAKTFNDMQSNVEEVFNGEEAMGSIRVGNIECKNLLKNTATSKTQNGVTFTVNPDGTVHVKGTATANTYLKITDGNLYLPAGMYTISGGYANSTSYVNYQGQHSDGTTFTNSVRSNGSREFELVDGDVINYIQIRIGSGATIDYTFKPQLEKGTVATEFTPYKKFGYNDRESMGKIVVDDISCKNLLDLSDYNGNSQDGITFTKNTDGTISVRGTKTSSASLYETPKFFSLPAGTYTISGCPNGGGSSTYALVIVNNVNNAVVGRDYGSGATFSINEGTYCRLQLNIYTTTEVALLFKPQLELGDKATPYTPYKGFGYTSGSNENGSWVKYADGRLECRKKMTFPATPITTATGSLYESASLTIGDFPMPFVGDYPDVFIMPCGMFFVERYPSDSLTSFGKFRACKPTSVASTDITVSILAIGKWKNDNSTSPTMMYSPRPTINGDETNTLEDEITTLEETLEEI